MGRAPDALGGATRLVAVKAVSETYPLRGELQLRSAAGGPVSTVAAAPERAPVWVDSALLDALATRTRRPAAARRYRTGDHAPHRRRARPRRRLHELRAARPAGAVRSRADGPRPAGQPRQLPAGGRRPEDWSASRGDAAVREFVRYAEDRIKRAPLRGVSVGVGCRAAGRDATGRWTAPRNSSTWWRCWRRCWRRWRGYRGAREFASRHLDDCAMLRVLGSRSAASPVPTRWSSGSSGWPRAFAGVLIGLAVHFVFVWLLAGLVDSALPAPGPGRRCSASAWA